MLVEGNALVVVELLKLHHRLIERRVLVLDHRSESTSHEDIPDTNVAIVDVIRNDHRVVPRQPLCLATIRHTPNVIGVACHVHITKGWTFVDELWIGRRHRERIFPGTYVLNPNRIDPIATLNRDVYCLAVKSADGRIQPLLHVVLIDVREAHSNSP